MAAVDAVLHEDPMNAVARFVRAIAQLAVGDAAAAASSLRAALYAEPDFALAAFRLGRAYDVLGQPDAARRAYQRALRTFDPDDVRHGELLGPLDVADVAAACRQRLRALAEE